jgi:tRNA (guanine26-N2/guanine27-N2)-dimethyltransferase
MLLDSMNILVRKHHQILVANHYSHYFSTVLRTMSTSYKTITEGSAVMVYPAHEQEAVFYNPVQVQNRDLSTLMIALYVERRRQRQQQQDDGIHILDALAASGLRSIRYWNEIPGISHITINDLDAAAVERAHANLQHNQLTQYKVTDRSPGIRILHGDATHELYQSRDKPYDVIDLDPYGSAAPFLDAAVQALADGGLLNVTCTDMVALGGSHPETAYARYGSLPLSRAPYLHEAALRILLKTLAQTAATYGRTLRPILSVGMDFYIRCFVEIYHNKAGVNQLSLQIGSVYQSTQCPSFLTIPHGQQPPGKNVYQATRAPGTCPETGAPYKVGGPLWLGPLHDVDVVTEALTRLDSSTTNLATKARLQGLLTTVREELPDVPLYYTVPTLCHTLSCVSPPLAQVKAALVNAGYRVSGYHKEPQAIKTNAPNAVVWDIFRHWCLQNPPKKKKDEAGATILAVAPTIQVDFTIPKEMKNKNNHKIARFPMNPEKNWGPKPRATGKRKRNDNTLQQDESKQEETT